MHPRGAQRRFGRSSGIGPQGQRGGLTLSEPGNRRRVLYAIACGGRPAADLPAFVAWTQECGWDVCVIATFLRECGVNVIFDPAAHPLPAPNLGEESRKLFPWQALRVALAGIEEDS